MPKPSLTIAIPFHAGIDYLRLALQSVLEQEDAEWKLIVCDDGKQPNQELQAFLQGLADPRVRYHRNPEPAGMVANWNLPFGLADTELLTLLHQDDLLLPNYVGLVREMAVQYPEASAFYTGARIIDHKGEACFSMADWIKRFLVPGGGAQIRLQGSSAVEALLRGNFIMCPTLCFRRAERLPTPFDARWKQVQDLELLCRMLMQGSELRGTSELAYAYRRHAQAATAKQSESLLRFAEECSLLDDMSERCVALGWQHAARIADKKRMIKLHLCYRILGDLMRLRFGRAKAKGVFLWRQMF